MTDNHRYCVIMCGGIGSRFWPYSRTDRPNTIIGTNSHYAPLVKEQLPELNDDQILLEPARRNTAPCIAWAAYHIAARDPQASMIVTPSDHLITRDAEFEKSIRLGFNFVGKHDALLTLGIKPTRPETGYGYIQIGRPVEDDVLKVKTFTEKPDIDLAKVFVESGEFFWNSGIFLWSVKSILGALNNSARLRCNGTRLQRLRGMCQLRLVGSWHMERPI